MFKWIGGIVLLFVAIGAFIFFVILPPRVDKNMNPVIAHDPYPISADAQALHDDLIVADLHADTLLWKRDPVKRQTRGQTDLPRLREGGVRLQVFTAVTKTPKNMNYDENEAGSDQITLLAIGQRWPRKSWFNIFERAMYQASRMDRIEAVAGDRFVYVKTKDDLEDALNRDALAGVYGIEGAHALEGEIENLDRLYDAGLRVIGLQHFFDNAVGGSLHGQSGAGLTEFGEAVVDKAVALDMIIDVAHSSEQVVRDVLARTDKPVIISHTGLKGHCNTARNIPDDLMKAIADHGGLVGIGFWDGAICDPSPEGIASAIVYAVNFLGADHVALGSDFDGTVTTPFDASELAALTQALVDADLSEDVIRAVMGGNAIRFFSENLPSD